MACDIEAQREVQMLKHSMVKECDRLDCSSKSTQESDVVDFTLERNRYAAADGCTYAGSSAETGQGGQSCSSGGPDVAADTGHGSGKQHAVEKAVGLHPPSHPMLTRSRRGNALTEVDIDDLLLTEHFDDATEEEYSSTDDNGVYVRFVRAVFTGDDAMASMDDDEEFSPACSCAADSSSAASSVSDADSGDDMCNDDALSPAPSTEQVVMDCTVSARGTPPVQTPEASIPTTFTGGSRKLSAAWTTAQFRQLYHQVHIHVQLLVQLYAICAKDPSDAASQLASQVLAMLRELQRQCSGSSAFRAACNWQPYSPSLLGMHAAADSPQSLPTPSFWSPPFVDNVFSILDTALLRLLPSFLEAMDGVPMADDSALDIMRALLMGEKLSKKQKGVGIHVLVQNMLFVAGRALAILQPHLDSALLPAPGPCVKSQLWSPAEDELLALGISRLGRDWRRIQQAYFPGKTVSQVVIRQKNVCARYGNAAVKVAKQRVMGPLTAAEIEKVQQGLVRFADVRSERQKWECISQHYLPHRTSNQLQQLWKGTVSDEGEENVEMTNQLVTQAPFLFPSLRDCTAGEAHASAGGPDSDAGILQQQVQTGARNMNVEFVGPIRRVQSAGVLVPSRNGRHAVTDMQASAPGGLKSGAHVTAARKATLSLGASPRLNTAFNPAANMHGDRPSGQRDALQAFGSTDTSDPSPRDQQPELNVVTSPGQIRRGKHLALHGSALDLHGAGLQGRRDHESDARKRRRSSTVTSYTDLQRHLLRTTDSVKSVDSGSSPRDATALLQSAGDGGRETHTLSIHVPHAACGSPRQSPASLRITFPQQTAARQDGSEAWHEIRIRRNSHTVPDLPHWLNSGARDQEHASRGARSGLSLHDGLAPARPHSVTQSVPQSAPAHDVLQRMQGQELKQSLDELKHTLASCKSMGDVQALRDRLPASVNLQELLQLLSPVHVDDGNATSSPGSAFTQSQSRQRSLAFNDTSLKASVPTLRIVPTPQNSPNTHALRSDDVKSQRSLRLDCERDEDVGVQEGGEQPAAAQALKESLRLMGPNRGEHNQGGSVRNSPHKPTKVTSPSATPPQHSVQRSPSYSLLPSLPNKPLSPPASGRSGLAEEQPTRNAAIAMSELVRLGAVDADKLLTALMCQPQGSQVAQQQPGSHAVANSTPAVSLQAPMGGNMNLPYLHSLPVAVSAGQVPLSHLSHVGQMMAQDSGAVQPRSISADEASRHLIQLLQAAKPSSPLEALGQGPLHRFDTQAPPSLPHQLLQASMAMRVALNPLNLAAHSHLDSGITSQAADMYNASEKRALSPATLDQAALSFQAKRRRLSSGSPPLSMPALGAEPSASAAPHILRPLARQGPVLSLLPASQQQLSAAGVPFGAADASNIHTMELSFSEGLGRAWMPQHLDLAMGRLSREGLAVSAFSKSGLRPAGANGEREREVLHANGVGVSLLLQDDGRPDRVTDS